MRAIRFLAAVAMLAGAVVARADVTSGPQVGERVGAFEVTKVAGDAADGVKDGQHLCYRCRAGAKPVVMVFARTADEKLAKLLKEVEKEVTEHEDAKLTGVVNLIGADAESLKKAAADFAAKHDVKRIVFVVPDDAENGPPNLNIAPDAAVTVICYREGKVKANHVFPKDGLTDDSIGAVVASASALVE